MRGFRNDYQSGGEAVGRRDAEPEKFWVFDRLAIDCWWRQQVAEDVLDLFW